MTKSHLLRIFNADDAIDLPVKVQEVLDSDGRDEIFKELIHAYNADMSYDWFQSIYEEELAQRKQNKQDFTPRAVSQLCSGIVGAHHSVHEPTAGNGSMIIADWWSTASKMLPWEFQFFRYRVDCWELSDRAIPILLLNLAIRGIVGVVHHGDVIEGTEKARYILSCNDVLSFSKIAKVI